MQPLHVLAAQWMISLTVYVLLARWFVAPYLRRQSVHAALILVTLPHLVRHVSAMSLAPGVAVAPSLSQSWAWAVSVGDLITLVLALLAVAALRGRWAAALALCWIAHIVGILDILHVGVEARRHGVVPHLGAQWYVVAMAVPMLVVTHALALATLVRRGGALRRRAMAPEIG